MRVLIVSQYFWPENFRINDLAEELVKRGHEVTILTGKPNYPSGELFPEFEAKPDEFSEYRGCRVVRVPIVMRGQGSGRKLVSNYISYVLSASIIGFFKLRKQRFDVTFVYEPSPVTVCLPAIFYKKLKGTPVVFWVLDLWPETLEAIGVVKSPRILSWVGKLVSYIYNRCDLVLGQSKAFYEGISQYCEDENKIKYFPSWSEPVFLESSNSSVNELMESGSFKVLFAGNIGDAQDFPAILLAAEEIKSHNHNIKIYVVGDGRAFNGIKHQVKEKGLEDIVILLGRFPLDDMPAFYSAADALLVTLKESKAFSMTIPGKIQTYMAAGKPILTMLSGEGSRVVDEAQCGLTAKSGDHLGLAKNMISLSECTKDELLNFGVNANTYAEKEFDRYTLISQLESWFEEVSLSSKENKL
ncbi:glycosyltransferase family 4 protein [Thiomicrorhabdus xiamenensis]|uniref:Glycosyltransferase family 4 protein n=1 Tax=Thiomicrorhabdus xiamenensis TaxID=2739063 RepID=A0A7D4TEW8_9GAMM|nr:glycosyltransferase family 4 protein [Thiomicrorhabdus xiamenensis]QKI89767.1 glycosyltransferase family 4 protein [Thiomicrorhabdus xiamenensis]